MLTHVPENRVENPVYLERDFSLDDWMLGQVEDALFTSGNSHIELRPDAPLSNRNKTVGGQLAIDMERKLNHQIMICPLPLCAMPVAGPFLKPPAIALHTHGSAGQSFGAFCNDGMAIGPYRHL